MPKVNDQPPSLRIPQDYRRVHADSIPADQRSEGPLVPRRQGSPGERGRDQELRSGPGT